MKTFSSFIFFPLLFFIHTQTELFCQGTWTQRADFGGTARQAAIGLSINGKGYIGTGHDGTYRNDFWEYDVTANSWMQKADFAGGPRNGAVAFTISGKGYVGTGYDSFALLSDFWEYDPLLNTWSKKSDFPVPIAYASGFSIGNKGYVCAGMTTTIGSPTDDLWEWNPSTDAWTQKAVLLGDARYRAVSFSIGNRGYIAVGSAPGSEPPSSCTIDISCDLWEWNSITNSWTQQASLNGGRDYAIGFSIGTKGYVGLGANVLNFWNDFWEWDQSSNTWTQMTNFPDMRIGAVGFSIGNRGYVGTGRDSNQNLKNDFWEFDPTASAISENSNENQILIFPNPAHEQIVIKNILHHPCTFSIYALSGKLVYTTNPNVNSSVLKMDISSLHPGVYFLEVLGEEHSVHTKFIKE